jgi:hypothetical protein
MVLDLDDDMRLEDRCHHIHHRRRHLFRMDYFFAGSAVFASTLVAGDSLLTGVALASTLQVLSLAGSHFAGAAGAAALAAGAGAAGAAVLAGSVAKAAVATKVAIRVAIVFI